MQTDLGDRRQDSRGSVVVLLVVKLASLLLGPTLRDQTRPLTMAPVAKLKQASNRGIIMMLIVVSFKSLKFQDEEHKFCDFLQPKVRRFNR